MGESSDDRLPLIDRVVSERLTASGVVLLLDTAEVLSEGDAVPAGGTYYGSVMLTIDTGALAGRVSEALDDVVLGKLAELMESDLGLRRRLVEIARVETSNRCGGLPLDACDLDIVFRAEPPCLLVDIDVQARVSAVAPAAEA